MKTTRWIPVWGDINEPQTKWDPTPRRFPTIKLHFWLLDHFWDSSGGHKEESQLVLTVWVVLSSSSRPFVPLVLHYYFPLSCFPPPFIFLFLFFHIESSPEDLENNLTSQLSLKQCGLGPRLCSVYRGESTASKGQPGPLALRRTRQVAPHFFTLVWCENRNKHHSEFYDFENVNTDYSFVISV